jgi:hypothetical protein
VTVVFILATTILAPLLTWFYTGPAGHLVAGVLDWVALLGRYAWARARRRDPWPQPHAADGR